MKKKEKAITPSSSRSSESARDCRKRKSLRIQYLAQSVQKRELAVIALKREVDSLMEACRRIDAGENFSIVLRNLNIDVCAN